MSTTTSIEITKKDYSKFENFDSNIKAIFYIKYGLSCCICDFNFNILYI
jgi:hypothetical protein